MSKKNYCVPIIANSKGVQYKLFYINFFDDDSIKISFPRKDGYKATGLADLPDLGPGYTQVELGSVKDEHYNPRITFHSGKGGVIHVTSDGGKFKQDLQVKSYPNNLGGLTGPLMQISFSNMSKYLDKIQKVKYPNNLSINTDLDCLNIEIWVHPVGGFMHPDDLPHREAISNPIGFTKIPNPSVGRYTVSLFVSEFPSKLESIIVSVPNGTKQYVFEMKPKKERV
jgi:hypothetical protein